MHTMDSNVWVAHRYVLLHIIVALSNDSGDVEKVIEDMQRSRNCMSSLLSLDEFLEFEAPDELKHMRIQELASWLMGRF